MIQKSIRCLPVLWTLVLVVSLCTVGCSKRDDPILRLSADEALDLGKQFLADEKYYKARRHLIHAFEVEPNSRSGREALLLAADALFLQGGTENFIKCEAKYRDFLNRFPTSDRADYAQFKVAACLAARSERPDRDQKVTRQAIESYGELLRLYPTSTYVADTRQRILELTDQLAAHEMVIGRFYNRYAGRGICTASINRFEYLQENFPEYSGMDEVLYQLSIAYHRCLRSADALESLADLRRRYPDSEWLDEAAEMEQEVAEAAVKQKQAREAAAQAKAAAEAEAETETAEES
ncbi:MAG: outer membrane protein assembly factor BamD [Acidobacteriota bacterium]